MMKCVRIESVKMKYYSVINYDRTQSEMELTFYSDLRTGAVTGHLSRKAKRSSLYHGPMQKK